VRVLPFGSISGVKTFDNITRLRRPLSADSIL